jgi:hypothetical protein
LFLSSTLLCPHRSSIASTCCRVESPISIARSKGVEALKTRLASGRGCLLFGAHFGSFDFLRVLGLAECTVPVNVLMHQRDEEKLNAVLDPMNPRLPMQIIRLGQSQTMLQVAEALGRGEIVALLADRVVAGDKMVPCEFLGDEAPLPEGTVRAGGNAASPGGFVFGRLWRWAALPDSLRALCRAYCAGARESRRRVARLLPALRPMAGRKLPVRSVQLVQFLRFLGAMSRVSQRMRLAETSGTRWWRWVLAVLACAIAQSAFAFDVAELMAMMAKVERSTVVFEETKHVAALTTPLVRRGTLRYVRPDQLQMHVEEPYFERMSVTGERLTIERAKVNGRSSCRRSRRLPPGSRACGRRCPAISTRSIAIIASN